MKKKLLALTWAIWSIASVVHYSHAEPISASPSSGWSETSFSDIGNELHPVYPEERRLSAAWLPPGWAYRKSHTINGSTVGLLSDYAVRIVVHYGSGADSGQDVYLDNNCRADFGDIRFTGSDGSTQLDYWIEEKIDGNNAVFWVEADIVPASPGSATIYMYYCNNNAATQSSGRNTFDWFDDFAIDSSSNYYIGRNATLWHGSGAYNPYYDPVNRRVAYDTGDNFSGGWTVIPVNLLIQNFAAKVTFGVTASYPYNTTNAILGRLTGDSSYYGFSMAGGSFTSPALVRDARTTIIASPPSNTYHPFGGIPHTAELRIYGSSLTGIYNEGEADEVVLSATDSTHSGAGQVEVIVGQAAGWFDVFFVRKYVEPEPGHGPWGSEEGIPRIFITPPSHDFGPVSAGSSFAVQTFSISNTGSADLVVGTITLSGTDASDFSIHNDNCRGQSIPPSDTCVFDVMFSPSSAGLKSAASVIPSNDPDDPLASVLLEGKGTVGEVTLFTPNGDEVIPAGSTYTIRWHSYEAASFRLKYSMKNGRTWRLIDDNVAGTSYDWVVPAPMRNKRKSLVRVEGFDASGERTGADKSDAPFTIEVVRLGSPNGGENLVCGVTHTIMWTTNETKRDVEKVKLYYTRNRGRTWKKIITLPGNPGRYDEFMPMCSKRKSRCKIKVRLEDANGKRLGTDKSDDFLAIQPAP